MKLDDEHRIRLDLRGMLTPGEAGDLLMKLGPIGNAQDRGGVIAALRAQLEPQLRSLDDETRKAAGGGDPPDPNDSPEVSRLRRMVRSAEDSGQGNHPNVRRMKAELEGRTALVCDGDEETAELRVALREAFRKALKDGDGELAKRLRLELEEVEGDE